MTLGREAVTGRLVTFCWGAITASGIRGVMTTDGPLWLRVLASVAVAVAGGYFALYPVRR